MYSSHVSYSGGASWGSAILADPPDDSTRAVARLDRYTDDFTAPRFHDIASDDGVGGPVRALHQNVRLHGRDQIVRRLGVEHDDPIDACERGDHFGPFVFRIDRTSGALDGAHRPVAVDPDE